MKKLLTIAIILIGAACSAKKAATSSTVSSGNTRSQVVEYLSESVYLLKESTADKTYGYQKSNPIKVGGAKKNSGPFNQRSFLNALLGPNGEETTYKRNGSCCPFNTPNSFLNNTGFLDIYEVSWNDSKDKIILYLNMYDEGDLFIPVGLTARK